MAVMLSALRAARPLPPGRFLVLISVRGSVDPRGHSAAGSSIEKYNNLNGNRTRDLPACSLLPQPTTLPRARVLVWRTNLILASNGSPVWLSGCLITPLFERFSRVTSTSCWPHPELTPALSGNGADGVVTRSPVSSLLCRPQLEQPLVQLWQVKMGRRMKVKRSLSYNSPQVKN
jgi:hypothetical protein